MLTERKIRDAKPGPKTVIMRDGEVTGLAVRIAPGGTKAYVLDYRANSRRRLATLARCSEISLKEARAIAGRELVAIRAGEQTHCAAGRTAPRADRGRCARQVPRRICAAPDRPRPALAADPCRVSPASQPHRPARTRQPENRRSRPRRCRARRREVRAGRAQPATRLPVAAVQFGRGMGNGAPRTPTPHGGSRRRARNPATACWRRPKFRRLARRYRRSTPHSRRRRSAS